MRKLATLVFCCTFSSFAYAAPVDVNRASAAEIAQALKGIGLKKAQNIVQHCQKQRRCTRPEDLLAVKGIGPKTLQKIRADLRFGPGPGRSGTVKTTKTSSSTVKRSASHGSSKAPKKQHAGMAAHKPTQARTSARP